MAYAYQAMNTAGQLQADIIDAPSLREAAELLRQRGLFVTKIEEAGGAAVSSASGSRQSKPGGRRKDVVFLTQQMSMLLRSGAQVVQALEAVEEPCQNPRWKKVISTIRGEVEEGRPLSMAMAKFPKLFPAFYSNMLAAGEASGDLGLAFERLSRITYQQQDIRNRVLGSLAYPAVLMLMCAGVVIALFTFVLPRFAEMFETLGVELPITTEIMIVSAAWVQQHWVIVFLALAASATGTVLFLRSDMGRRFISRFSVRVPIFGKIVRNVSLATILRIWGQLLESKVSLLESVQLIRQSIRSLDYQELLAEVEQAIIDGNRVGPRLKQSWLVPPTFAAAIATGEESGRLADALLFVAACMEEENTQVLGSLTRVIEPIILVLMGLIVGTVAVSLFTPMFDMVNATGG